MNAFLIPIFVVLHVIGTLARGYGDPSPHLFGRLPQSAFSFDLDSSDDSITADDFAKVLISLPSFKRSEVYDALLSVIPFLEPGSNVYSFIDSLPNAVRDQASVIRNPYLFGGAQHSSFAPLFNSPGMRFTSLLAPLLATDHSQPRPYGLPHPHRHRKSPGHTCHRRHRIVSPTHGIDLDFTSIVSTFPLDSDDKSKENSADETNPDELEKTKQGDLNKTDNDSKDPTTDEGQTEKQEESEANKPAVDSAQDATTNDDSLKSDNEKSGETNENTADQTKSETVPEEATEVIPEESAPASEPTLEQPAPEQQPQPEQSTITVDKPATVVSEDKTETQIESEPSETTEGAAAPVANPQIRSLKRSKQTKGQPKKRNAATNKANAEPSAENTVTAQLALESESSSPSPASAAAANESVVEATNEVANEESLKSEETPKGGKPKKSAGVTKVPRRRQAPKSQ